MPKVISYIFDGAFFSIIIMGIIKLFYYLLQQCSSW